MTVSQISSHPRFKRVAEAPVSKAQLALLIGFSKRWIELRHADGLPVHRGRNGYARYFLSEVEPWISEWLERRGA